MTKLRTYRLFPLALGYDRGANTSKEVGLPAMFCILCLFCVAAAITAPAQSVYFTSLASFDGANGANPFSSLIQATDGNFYGTTNSGGAYNWGTVFKITPSGGLTTLYSFCSGGLPCADGSGPYGALVQAGDGNFYGTTESSGANGSGGTVFKITPQGALTTLYSFCSQPDCADGADPYAGLVQGTDGAFYGTTRDGGGTNCVDCGTVFKITPEGTLTRLHSFDGSDGIGPSDALIQARDGNLYGTTYFGGLGNAGTVFRITPTGELTTLHSFYQYPDGSGIVAPVVQASDGNFYGTTSRGGHYDGGTAFQMSPDGTLGWVYYFGLGSAPTAGLVQASDGNLYGTTSNLNAGYGTIFKITPAGTLTTLHDFNGRDGTYVYAGLVLASDGDFYGTTVGGGAYGDGTVYRFGVVRACATCRP